MLQTLSSRPLRFGPGNRYWARAMSKFFFTFGLIVSGLLIGYGIQTLNQKKVLRLPLSLDQLRRALQKLALLFINSIAVVGAIWTLEIDDGRMAAFPVL